MNSFSISPEDLDKVIEVLEGWQALVNLWYADDALEHLGGNIIKRLGHETDNVAKLLLEIRDHE